MVKIFNVSMGGWHTQTGKQDEAQASKGEWPRQHICAETQATNLHRRRCKDGPDLIQQIEDEGDYHVGAQSQHHLQARGFQQFERCRRCKKPPM